MIRLRNRHNITVYSSFSHRTDDGNDVFDKVGVYPDMI